MGVGVVRGAAALGERLVGVAAVGRGHGPHSLPHVGADRGGAGVADAADGAAAMARVGILGNLVDVGLVGVHHELVHGVVIVAVLGGVVHEHLADLLTLLAREVGLQRVGELGRRDAPLVKDELLDGREGVGHVGDAHLEA